MSDPRQKVVVPYFPGFYQGTLDEAIDGGIDRLVKTGPWTEDEIYQKAYFCTSRDAITRAWLRTFNEVTGLSLKLEVLNSPKEYNFRTDCIFAYISADDVGRLVDARTGYPDSFKEALRRMFTYRDGFIPAYDDDPCSAEWQTPVSTWDHNQMQVLLRAYVLSGGIVEEMLRVKLDEAQEEFIDLAAAAITLEMEGHECDH